MNYTDLSYFQKYNKYTFYKGVYGGLQELISVFAFSLEGAKKTAIENGIQDWDFIITSQLIIQ